MRTPVRWLTLGLTLIGAACGGGSDAPPPAIDGDVAVPASGPAPAGTRDLDAYPQAYRTMDLPALPDGTVTSTGRQTTSLRDGLAIQLTTSMGIAETRDYYRQAMIARGWTEDAGPGQAAQAMLPNLPLARLAFTQGPLSYTVTATANDGTTQVSITLIER